MKPLTDFLPEVLPSVIGCPVPLAVNAVRNSVIEFLTESTILDQRIEIALVPGEPTYPVDAATGTSPTLFLRGYLDEPGRIVQPTSPTEMDALLGNWRSEQGAPRRAFLASSSLTVYPVPVDAGTLYADFAYTVDRTASQVADEMVDTWAEAIAAGALRRLLIVPGTPWANPEMAAFFGAQFNTAIDKAKIDKLRGATVGSLRVSPRAFQ